MNEISQIVAEHLKILGALDYFTLGVNFFILVFSKKFANHYGGIKDENRSRVRLRILHCGNFLLFATYLVAVVFEFRLAVSFSQTFLVILASYLLIHFVEAVILRKYGKTRTIEEVTRTTETHTSRTLELVVCAIIFCIATVLLINIWGFEDWLQTTSVLGFLALLVFATKEYWAGDFLSGIILIGQGRIERGDVLIIKEEGIRGIVLQINGLQTLIRDLVDGHDIILPNYKLRQSRVDVLKTDLRRGVRNHVDFMIGYGTPSEKVNAFLSEVWERAVSTGLVLRDISAVIALKESGDHGNRWRISYTLKSPHRLIETKNAIRKAAYDLQEKHGTELATPTTIRFPDGHFPKADEQA